MPRFLLVALAVTVGIGVAPGARPAAAPTAAPRARTAGALRWSSCGGGFQCSTLSLPVDYAAPDGAHFDLAVDRLRATDERHRVGALVLNFGGPGDPGTETLRSFASAVPKAIRSRFDLVSFDPRGIGGSKPIECLDDAQQDELAAADPTPNGTGDLPSFYAGTNEPVDLVQACIDRNGTWLAQVGTRNVARDLDRLRAALGSARLYYIGLSYGTVIGAVYAQMFPKQVGRMVVDSPVDLSQTPEQELDGNAVGFEHALDEFLAWCAGTNRCAFRSGGDPKSALVDLQRRFEAGLTVPTKGVSGAASTRRAGVGAFYTGIIAALYDKTFGWAALAQGLEQAARGDGTILQELADSYNGRRSDGSYDNIQETIGVIRCDDRFDARESYDAFVADYQRLTAQFEFLGGLLGSSPIGCDPRLPQVPAAEMAGDVRVRGTVPILVVGTTNDPATPYVGAQDIHRRLARSRLLTFQSTEHGAFTRSDCVDSVIDAYLLDGHLPPTGKGCKT